MLDHFIMFLIMFAPFVLCLAALAAVADFILYRQYKRRQKLMARRIKQ